MIPVLLLLATFTYNREYCVLGFYRQSSVYQDWVQEQPECPLGYSHLQFCVDNEMSSIGCRPAKQILYFDVLSPNEYIMDAVWEDATDVVPQIITCNPSNEPTLSPTDPSNRPTASPNKPTPSPTDNPFAQIHAGDSKTQPPTQSVTDTTNFNHGFSSTDNVDTDSAAHDAQNITGNALVVMWIGVICALWVVASIFCFLIWKCHGKFKDVHIDNIENIVHIEAEIVEDHVNPATGTKGAINVLNVAKIVQEFVVATKRSPAMVNPQVNNNEEQHAADVGGSEGTMAAVKQTEGNTRDA
eukprot:276989_1